MLLTLTSACVIGLRPDTQPTPPPTSVTTGEIWEWAIGRNVWTDPALEPYAREVGTDDGTDIDVQSEGFKLTLDSTGTVVVSVTVFNDENALGLPGMETNFSPYRGELPLGLTWADTATSLLSAHPAYSAASGGYGTSITFTYVVEGYRFDVALQARHESDVPGSALHYIVVGRG